MRTPKRGGDLDILSNFPSGLEAAAGCIECLGGAASVLARRASQERRMTSPTAGRIGNAGAHTDHVNPDRAENKSATFRSGLSPVPAPPGRHKDREWSRRCNQRSQGSTCFYDEQHRITYLRMLDADAEGVGARYRGSSCALTRNVSLRALGARSKAILSARNGSLTVGTVGCCGKDGLRLAERARSRQWPAGIATAGHRFALPVAGGLVGSADGKPAEPRLTTR